MWVVGYLPEAEQERAALPKAERAALINADAELGAYGPCSATRTPVRWATRTGCGSCGRGQDAAPGGRCTGRSARCSWWRRSGRRPNRIRGFGRAVRRALQRLAEA